MGAELILTLLVVILLGGVIVLANRADQTQRSGLRQAVIVSLVVINVLIVIVGLLQVGSAYLPESELGDSEPPEKSAAWGGLVVALFFAGLATAILFPAVRHALIRIFPRYRPEKHEVDQLPIAVTSEDYVSQETPGTPLFPQMLNYYTTESQPPVLASGVVFHEVSSPPEHPVVRGFNPQSMVHTVALALALYYLGSQIMGFILSGGLSGVAESFEEGISGWDLLLNVLPQIVLPVLGVGFLLRRSLPETFKRLGLFRPTLQGLGVAVAATIALFMFVLMANFAWMSVVSKETYEEQTEASNALSESINTIGLAFLLALQAAVGEELVFRGALQPVFGLWPTAIFFALVHLQYTLTPASLIILIVAITFGWIRQHYGTTIAILTHFLYNFIPLLLSLGITEEAISYFK